MIRLIYRFNHEVSRIAVFLQAIILANQMYVVVMI